MSAEIPNVRQVHGYCSLCIARCGTVATVTDGRFTRLDPDPTHPTGAAICAKGRAAPELVYHKDQTEAAATSNTAKGRRGSGMGRNFMGCGARPDRRRHAPHRGAAWTSSGRLQPIVPLDNSYRGFRGLRSQTDECFRHAQPGIAPRPVRLGTWFCDALCLRRWQRCHRKRWRRDGRHCRIRLSHPVGL